MGECLCICRNGRGSYMVAQRVHLNLETLMSNSKIPDVKASGGTLSCIYIHMYLLCKMRSILDATDHVLDTL